MGLILCTKCQRHVKAHDRHCPFCGTSMQDALTRRSLAMGAVFLGIVAACGGSTEDGGGGGADGDAGGSGGSGGTPSMDAAYGPPPDAGGSGGAYGPPPPTDGGNDGPTGVRTAAAHGRQHGCRRRRSGRGVRSPAH